MQAWKADNNHLSELDAVDRAASQRLNHRMSNEGRGVNGHLVARWTSAVSRAELIESEGRKAANGHAPRIRIPLFVHNAEVPVFVIVGRAVD